jgi:hypothetical protein
LTYSKKNLPADNIHLSKKVTGIQVLKESSIIRFSDGEEISALQTVADSWRFGKAAHSKNPLFHYGYRFLLTHGPEYLIRRQEKFLNDLGYLDKL